MSESTILTIYIMAHNMFGSVFKDLARDLNGTATLMQMIPMAAAGIGVGLAAISGISVKMASDFDQQLARIAGLTDTSAQMMDFYKQKLLEMSPQLDMSASDAARSLYFIVSAGFSGQRALDVLSYSAKSATASLADQAAVSDALTSMLNAYKDANISAADGANTLTRIEVYGKAQLQSFASSLGFTMVTAHAAGLSLHEAGAAMATLSQVSGSHGIRRMDNDLNNLMRSMLSIDDVAKRSAAELKAMGIDDAESFKTVNARAADMGITFDKLKFASLDFMGKLQYLAQISGYSADQYNSSREQMLLTQYAQINATKGEAAATAFLNLQHDEGAARFMKMIGGAAAFIPALTLLTDHGKEYTYVLGQMNDKTDTVQHAFDTMRGSTAQQWKMFELAVQNILVILGLQLLPVVNKVLQALRGIGMAIIGWLQAPGAMDTLKWALLGIAIVISGPIVAALSMAVIHAAPFLLVMTAMIAAGIWLGNVLRDHPAILQAVQTALGRLGAIAQDVAKHIGDLIGYIQTHQWMWDVLKTAAITAAIVIGVNLVGAAITAIPALYSMAVAAWTAAIPMIAMELPVILLAAAIALLVFGLIQLVNHWSQVQAFFGNLGKAIGGFFSGLGSLTANAANGLVAFFKGVFATAADGIKNAFTATLNIGVWLYQNNRFVKQWVDQATADLKWWGQFFSAFGDELHHEWDNLVSTVEGWLNVGAWLGGLILKGLAIVGVVILEGISGWLSVFGKGFALLGKIKDTITTWVHDHIVKPMQDRFGGVGPAVQSKIADLWQQVKGYFQAGFLLLWNWLTQQLGNLLDLLGFTNAQTKAKQIMDGIKTNVVDPAIRAFQGLADGVKTVWDTVTTDIKNAINAVIGLVNLMIHSINGVKIQAPKVDLPGGGSVGGATIGFPTIPDIPYLYAGGMVTHGGLFNVGDQGTEQVYIPTGGGVVPHNFEDVLVSAISRAGMRGGGGGGVTYNLTINAMNPKDAAAEFEQIIIRHEQDGHRRNRRGGMNGGLKAF